MTSASNPKVWYSEFERNGIPIEKRYGPDGKLLPPPFYPENLEEILLKREKNRVQLAKSVLPPFAHGGRLELNHRLQLVQEARGVANLAKVVFHTLLSFRPIPLNTNLNVNLKNCIPRSILNLLY